jgi:hypothetical protein
LNVGKRRLAFNFGFTASGIGRELEQHRIEVQQKTLRCNVVGSKRLIVKACGVLIGQIKNTAIQNDVAFDFAQAFGHHIL